MLHDSPFHEHTARVTADMLKENTTLLWDEPECRCPADWDNTSLSRHEDRPLAVVLSENPDISIVGQELCPARNVGCQPPQSIDVAPNIHTHLRHPFIWQPRQKRW